MSGAKEITVHGGVTKWWVPNTLWPSNSSKAWCFQMQPHNLYLVQPNAAFFYLLPIPYKRHKGKKKDEYIVKTKEFFKHVCKYSLWVTNQTNEYPNIFECSINDRTNIKIYIQAEEKRQIKKTKNMTGDTWHVTCCGGWSFSKIFSSLALTVCYLWCFQWILTNYRRPNELKNYKAVYRTDLATPGLVNIHRSFIKIFDYSNISFS